MSDSPVARARTCRHGVARAMPRVAGVVLALALVAVLPTGIGTTELSDPWERAPSQAEIGLLALANKERVSLPTPVHPLVWDERLAEASRKHAVTLVERNCPDPHNCAGTMAQRLSRYYPAWTALAENIIFAA